MGSGFSRAKLIVACFFALNTIGLLAIYRAVWQKQGLLTVDEFTPPAAGRPGEPVLVTFNLPMCPPDQVGRQADIAGIAFEPPIPGRSVWRSIRQLAFYPSKPLAKATAYKARLSDTVSSEQGLSLAGQKEFAFRTAPLQLTAARQVRFDQHAQAVLQLEFDQEVVPQEVAKFLTVQTAKGNPVTHSLLGKHRSSQVTIRTQSLPNDEQLTLIIHPGLRGLDGPLPVEEEIRQIVPVNFILRLDSLSGHVPFDGKPFLTAKFNDSINLQRAAGFVRIDPPVKVELSDSWDGMRLTGDFQPQTRYDVTFLMGLPTGDGDELAQDVTRTVWMPVRESGISFVHQGGYLSPQGNRILPIKHANLSQAELTLARLYDNNIVHYLRDRNWSDGADLAKHMLTRQIRLAGSANEIRTTYLDLNEHLGADVRGVVLAGLEDPEGRSSSDSTLLVLSDLGVTIKQCEFDLIAWVVSLRRAEPLSGAQVRVFSPANQQLGTATTDEHGLARIPRTWADETPYVVTACLNEDVTYVELDRGRLSLVDQEVQGRPPLTEGNEAFLFTERGVVRPGENIHLQAIVRGPDWTLPGEFPVELRVQRPDQRPWKTLRGKLSASGTVHFDLPIPDKSLTGEYNARLGVSGASDSIGGITFLVEEYLPNRLDVAVEVPSTTMTSPQKFQAVVRGATMVGQPASSLSVQMVQTRQVEPFEHPKWRGWTFSDERSEKNQIDKEVIGTMELDDRGTTAFEIDPAPKPGHSQGMAVSVLSATVSELGGRAVTGSAEVRCPANATFLALRSNQERGQIDRPFNLEIAAVTPDGRSVPLEKVTLRVHRANWHTVVEQDDAGNYRYRSEQQWIECKQDTVRLATAEPLKYQYTAGQAGEYRLAVDCADPKAGATIDFYVSDGEWAGQSWSMSRPEQLEIVPDKAVYRVGETGRLLIKSPFAGTALLTLEGASIHEARVERIERNTAELPFVVLDTADTLYAGVSIVRPVDPERSPWPAHRAFGVTPIRVDRTDRQIPLEIDSPAEVRPPSDLKIDVTVGRPNVDVTLFAVDEGILSLTAYRTPDPFDWFYSPRALAVSTSDLYSRLMPETPRKLIGQAAPGGDGEMPYDPRRLSPISAPRTDPAVMWLGTKACDDVGRATFDVTIPDFEGQLRFMAVAVADHSFGRADRQILVRRPVTIQPSLPRFLAPGDTARPAVVVYNHTASEGKVFLDVTSIGPVNASHTGPAVRVAPNAGAMLNLDLCATDEIGPASVTVRARLGDQTAERTVHLSVRPSESFTAVYGSGTVKAGNRATVTPPADWVEGTGLCRIDFGGSPMIELKEAWDYLNTYPYGCVEQVTSSLLPLVYLGDLLEGRSGVLFARDIRPRIEKAVGLLSEMQTYDGGLATWPGYGDSYPYGSLYAAMVLLELQQSGTLVDPRLLQGLIDYCEAHLRRSASGRLAPGDLAQRAWACYVLTKAGKPPHAWIRRLREVQDQLSPTARSLLAATYLGLGDRAAAGQLLGGDLPPKNRPSETGGWLDSPTREEAILLSACLDANPAHPNVHQLVERLMARRHNGRWASTQETAFALMALGKYMRTQQDSNPDYTATVVIPGRETLLLGAADRKTFEFAPTAQGIVVDLRGRGTLHYAWKASGVPRTHHDATHDAGLHVSRHLFDARGATLDPGNIRLGELITVELLVTSEYPLENVVLVDPLPAGLEIENPHLASAENAPDVPKLDLPDRTEIRDDRLIAFCNVNKEYRFRYAARAICQGRFVLPAAQAQCQYDERVQGYSNPAVLEVRR